MYMDKASWLTEIISVTILTYDYYVVYIRTYTSSNFTHTNMPKVLGLNKNRQVPAQLNSLVYLLHL